MGECHKKVDQLCYEWPVHDKCSCDNNSWGHKVISGVHAIPRLMFWKFYKPSDNIELSVLCHLDAKRCLQQDSHDKKYQLTYFTVIYIQSTLTEDASPLTTRQIQKHDRYLCMTSWSDCYISPKSVTIVKWMFDWKPVYIHNSDYIR